MFNIVQKKRGGGSKPCSKIMLDFVNRPLATYNWHKRPFKGRHVPNWGTNCLNFRTIFSRIYSLFCQTLSPQMFLHLFCYSSSGVGWGGVEVGNGREQSGRNGPKIEYNSIWRLAGVVKIAAVIGRLRRGESQSEWTEFIGAEKCSPKKVSTQRACHWAPLFRGRFANSGPCSRRRGIFPGWKKLRVLTILIPDSSYQPNWSGVGRGKSHTN